MSAICDVTENTGIAVEETKLDFSGILFNYGKFIAKEPIKQEDTKKEYHTHDKKDYAGYPTEA